MLVRFMIDSQSEHKLPFMHASAFLKVVNLFLCLMITFLTF